jgi:cell division protease FtsH
VDSSRTRNLITIFIVLAAMGVLVYQQFQASNARTEVIQINQLAADLRAGKVKSIVVNENDLAVTYADGTEAKSRKEPDSSLSIQLEAYGVTSTDLDPSKVNIEVRQPSDWGLVLNLATYLIPVLLFGGLIYFMLRQAQGTNNQAISFGKSRARMFTGDQPTVTFDDVAGVEEAKEELREVELLKEPEKFICWARIPGACCWAPGTGKTLMAKAVSGEAGVPFFSISGSEFVEMFVGVGASRVRDLFDQAKRHSPCIVFVDEIDAVGRQRGTGLGGSHDEREQTLNQILVEMDGFDTDTNVIIMAATNRPDILDPALMRPGRFDRRVVLDRPDMRGREAILKVHVRGKPLAADINLTTLAKSTPGFVGADIENLVNEAAILAARRDKKSITMSEMEEAIERVIAGPERKSRLISEQEKRIIAYHEAGHAVVMQAIPECDPVHKVSIIARGMAGGYTLALPEEDRTLHSRNKFIADLSGLLGGRRRTVLTTSPAPTTWSGRPNWRATWSRCGMSDAWARRWSERGTVLLAANRRKSDYSDQVALDRSGGERRRRPYDARRHLAPVLG